MSSSEWSANSLSGKAVKSGDGRLVATGDKSKDRLKFIGIGAGAGLLLGTVTKQNSLLSLLLGAGAGYLYNETGNKPKPGDVKGFQSSNPRTLRMNVSICGFPLWPVMKTNRLQRCGRTRSCRPSRSSR